MAFGGILELCHWICGVSELVAVTDGGCRRLEPFHLSYAKHREDACTWKIFGSSQKSLISRGWKTTGLLLENGSKNNPVAEGDPSGCLRHGRGKPLPANGSGRVGSGEPGAQTTLTDNTARRPRCP